MKDLNDEDLKDISNKRRNAKFLDEYIMGRGDIYKYKVTGRTMNVMQVKHI